MHCLGIFASKEKAGACAYNLAACSGRYGTGHTLNSNCDEPGSEDDYGEVEHEHHKEEGKRSDASESNSPLTFDSGSEDEGGVEHHEEESEALRRQRVRVRRSQRGDGGLQ
jgi:hypothetical protein